MAVHNMDDMGFCMSFEFASIKYSKFPFNCHQVLAKNNTYVTPKCLTGTSSISLSNPVQLACCLKSTLTSLPLLLTDITTPILL